MKPLQIAAAAAVAWYFRAQILALLPGSTPAAPAPAPGTQTPAAAAKTAEAQGATPEQQAAAAQAVIDAAVAKALAERKAAEAQITINPTIAADAPQYHDALTAMSVAKDAASLLRVQASFGLSDSSYLLNTDQWNWYQENPGNNRAGIIIGATEVGSNGISAARYLQLRQARGLT